MTTRLNAYLSFRGNAREAMDFYRSVFGGHLERNTFAEFHASDDPAEADKIMHSMLVTDRGFVLMAADTPDSMDHPDTSNISLSLSGDRDDEAELRGYWDRLAEGGSVTMPLEPAPWGDTFGMCRDRFGVTWMVDIAGTAEQ